jgi:hypothetical protein
MNTHTISRFITESKLFSWLSGSGSSHRFPAGKFRFRPERVVSFMRPAFMVFGLTLFLASCTERIDVELDSSYTRLVVDGSITTDTTAHTVILTSTSSYFFNQPAPPVTGAQVSITDGTLTFGLAEAEPGVYRTAPLVHGVPGHTYTLNIKLAQPIGGHEDYSAMSTLEPVSPLDSVSLLFHPEWSKEGIWEVKCYVQEPPTVDFYRFLIYRNQKLVTDTLNEWFVTDDKFFNGNYTNGASVAYLQQGSPEEGLRPGDRVTLEVNSIGKAYYTFVTEAQAEIRGSNPLFSGPPSNVTGNITNGAVGFFSAHSVTRSVAVAPQFP